MAEARKSYRHTRTGAVRLSTKPLGYPYEAITKAEAADLDKTTEAGTEGAKDQGKKA